MCGIVALFERNSMVDAGVLRRMGRRLAHRGPDGEGEHLDGPVGLFHRRLAVIDLEDGAQPMASPDGQTWIVFNGEIYNYRELRDELSREGYRFRTRSDTEVLLALYARRGADLLDALNGMFAFVIYDRARKQALVARDHFGVKPLYRYADGARVAYASEIKALLGHPAIEARRNDDAIDDYLTFQHTIGPATLFAGIERVLLGHLEVLDLVDGTLQPRRFWTPRYAVDPKANHDQTVEQLDALLQDAANLQIRSDVPLGAHLSGGVDSSLVATLASKRVDGRLPVFHGCFDAGAQYDEQAHAEAVSQHADLNLIKIPITGERFAESMPRLIWHMDEPVAGPGLYPQFEVSQVARQHVTVVLGGQGGDELFCGYARYLVAYLEQALKGAIQENHDEVEHIVSLASIVPNLPYLRQYQPMLRQFWRDGVFESMDRRYFRLLDRSEGELDVFSAEFRARFDRDAVLSRFQTLFNDPRTSSYISKMRAFDRSASLPALLHVEDRVSMAVGLESRVPLLDFRIADLLDRLPPAHLFGGGSLKHLLREVAERHLPASVLKRKDKMGFPFPLGDWMRGVARDFVHDTLLSERARARGLFDCAQIERLLAERTPFSRKLWGLLCLELWMRTFLDADGEAPVG